MGFELVQNQIEYVFRATAHSGFLFLPLHGREPSSRSEREYLAHETVR
jgi:hypothetical protein